GTAFKWVGDDVVMDVEACRVRHALGGRAEGMAGSLRSRHQTQNTRRAQRALTIGNGYWSNGQDEVGAYFNDIADVVGALPVHWGGYGGQRPLPMAAPAMFNRMVPYQGFRPQGNYGIP